MIKKPAYLFQKLGRYIGISTYTGDFYDLSPRTYSALKDWNEEFSSLDSFPPDELRQKLAGKYRIPPDIAGLFPLREEGDAAEEENNGITDITLNLTSRCNLRCVYCWNDYGRYSNADFQEETERGPSLSGNEPQMSPQTACKAVDLLVNLSGEDKDLVVDFYGGEPLLNLDTLLAVVEYCREHRQRWGVEFSFLVATNGTLLTAEIARKLIGRGVQIAVSIDGSKETHDRSRPYADGKSSFAGIAANLKTMPDEIRRRLVGRVTVTPACADMVKLYGDLRALGFERIELFESEDACHKITPQREKFFFNTDEQYALLCREYERLARHYIEETTRGFLDYRRTFFNRFFKLMQRLYYHHEVSGGCPAAKGQIAVSASGDVYPCTSFLGVEKFKLGNVAEGLEREKYASFLETVKRRFQYCRHCPLFALCRSTGSCLNINYYFNADPARPCAKSCRLFREKLELAAAVLAVLNEKIPRRLEELFGFDAVGRRGNKLY